MPEFLLELFSEEIPARFQKQAMDDLKSLFTEKLGELGLAATTVSTQVTPRRLVLVADLPARIPSSKSSRKGPKIDAAENILAAFKQRLENGETLEQEDTPKGKVYVAVKVNPEINTADVLADVIVKTITALPWKKSMNWNETTFRWVRPLRSIIALFDGKIIAGEMPLGDKVAPLPFANKTRGHRFLSSGEITVTDYADYVQKLRAASVIVDRDERKAIILESANKQLQARGLTLKTDEALLEEVCGLVEYPVPLLGQIDQQFMDIPPEVLVTTMRNNQKYFAALDASGKMSSTFVVVANIPGEEGGREIIEGNQRVLRARFSDAKFFWDVDRGMKLEDRLPALAAVTFHAKLGSVKDKIARMEKLAVSLAIPGADEKEVATATRLAKADLTTGMVGEFPELQGIMGGYYARHDGHSDAIANAVTEHYSPLGPNDTCPASPVSIAVAMADKLDTLVGFFGIDEKPTGSKDPYALRRAALGVLRLIIENRLRLNLGQLIDAAMSSYGPLPSASLRADLLAFFADRLKVMLKDKGYRHDVISAVFSADNVADVTGQLGKLDALQKAVGTEEGKALLALYKRASNILRIEEKKDGKAYTGKPQLLEVSEEKALAEQLASEGQKSLKALQAEDFATAVQSLVSLRPALDAFFEKVTVNAENADLRASRLCLLAQIRDTLNNVADLSKIEGE